MKKVYLLQNDSIKCNFCTNWFNAPWNFVQQQRYSLNACEQCFKNPHYKIVNPKTYEIYDVKFVRTGISIIDKHQQICNKMDQLSQIYYEKQFAPFQLLQDLCAQNDIQNQEYEEYSSKTVQIKDKVDVIYQQLMDIVDKQHNKFLKRIEAGVWEFLDKKQQVVKKMQSKIYNYKSNFIPCPQQCQNAFNSYKIQAKKIKQKAQKAERQNLQQMLINFLKKHFNITFSNNHLKPIQHKFNNKQNINSNDYNYSSIRNKIKSNSKLTKSSKNLNIRNSRMTESYMSKSRNLKNSIALTDRSSTSRDKRTCKSQWLLSSIKYGFQTQIRPDDDFDIVRQAAITALRQKNQFESYFPYLNEEGNLYKNRIYGEKQHLQLLVEMKHKTVSTEKLLQLINVNLAKPNLTAYLKFINPPSTTQVIRLVKTELNDSSFDELLYWLKDRIQIQTLVLTNNKLSENCLSAIINFKQRHNHLKLKYVYLGNNFIKPGRTKVQVEKLKDMGVLVQI